MQNLLWIAVAVFVIAMISYLMNSRQKYEEKEDTISIIGTNGIYKGKTIPVMDEIVIGRDAEKCSVVYPNDAAGVSSVHCRLRAEENKVELTDEASTYGTYRENGERLAPGKSYYLEAGESFYIGDRKNTFLIK